MQSIGLRHARADRASWARGLAALISMLLISSPAFADAPPGIALRMVCSLDRRFCASRLPDARSVALWRKADPTRRPIWHARVTSPHFAVGDDGSSLVEIQSGLNLVERNTTADTVMLIFHRPGLPAVPLRLRDLAIDPRRLPVTVSHRVWAHALGFDGQGSFAVDTADGRHLSFDPSTGRPR